MDELVKAEFEKVAEQQKHQNNRLDKLEHSLEAINSLALSVQDLATNMKYMNDSLTKQGERLEALERQPIETMKGIRSSTWSTIIAVVLGAVLGAFIKSLINFM